MNPGLDSGPPSPRFEGAADVIPGPVAVGAPGEDLGAQHEGSTEPAPLPTPAEPRDPVAVAALVCAVLLLALPGVVLAGWGVVRARRDGRRGRLARAVLVVALVELVLAVAFWSVYFVVLAPVLTLPVI